MMIMHLPIPTFNLNQVDQSMMQKKLMSNETILIVDDEPANLAILNMTLTNDYKVRAANSGARALQVAETEPRPDLSSSHFSCLVYILFPFWFSLRYIPISCIAYMQKPLVVVISKLARVLLMQP